MEGERNMKERGEKREERGEMGGREGGGGREGVGREGGSGEGGREWGGREGGREDPHHTTVKYFKESQLCKIFQSITTLQYLTAP
jgi:hypothetical protein